MIAAAVAGMGAFSGVGKVLADSVWDSTTNNWSTDHSVRLDWKW